MAAALPGEVSFEDGSFDVVELMLLLTGDNVPVLLVDCRPLAAALRDDAEQLVLVAMLTLPLVALLRAVGCCVALLVLMAAWPVDAIADC